MEQIIDEALIIAGALADENLADALGLARGLPDARFLLPVLPLPQDDRNNARAAAQPQGQIVQRNFMCPELYRAAFSGAADELQDLLEAAGRHSSLHNMHFYLL